MAFSPSPWHPGYFSSHSSPPPSTHCTFLSLTELSTQGSRYINKEIQNAVQGVKHIKTLIEKTNAERKSLLNSLEEAKKKKEVGPSLG
jgi:clusterin